MVVLGYDILDSGIQRPGTGIFRYSLTSLINMVFILFDRQIFVVSVFFFHLTKNHSVVLEILYSLLHPQKIFSIVTAYIFWGAF